MRRPKNALNFSGLFEQFLAWRPGPKRTADVPRRQRRMRTAQLTHGWRRDQRPRITSEALRQAHVRIDEHRKAERAERARARHPRRYGVTRTVTAAPAA